MTTLSSYSGSTYTLQEVADFLGITRERARQIEMKALQKLKHPRFRKQWKDITESMDLLGNEK